MSGNIQLLGSIEAVRPVFMIVMGAFLALIAWRLAKSSGVWAARCLVTGSLLLGFGYSFLMPLYAAGVLRQYAPGIHYHGDTGSVLAWHVVKLVVMNSGWLFFGIGLALHANLLQPFAASPRKQPRRISPMNLLLEVILHNGLLLDAAGIIGLGLFGLAAVRLARRQQSWGGTMMAFGAIAVLAARLYFVASPFLITDEVLHMIGPIGISLTIGLPPLLLTLGLASIVWGLWGHERWLHAESR